MKYFTIQTHQLLLDSIQIKGWKEKLDTRWLCVDDLHRVAKRITLSLTTREFTPLPDIITTPFLMVTELVYGVIKMYGDMVYTRDVVLLDSENDIQKRYYLLVFNDSAYRGVPSVKRNIFYMDVEGVHKLVVSLDFAESILRRGAVGIALEELYFAESEGHYGK